MLYYKSFWCCFILSFVLKELGHKPKITKRLKIIFGGFFSVDKKNEKKLIDRRKKRFQLIQSEKSSVKKKKDYRKKY